MFTAKYKNIKVKLQQSLNIPNVIIVLISLRTNLILGRIYSSAKLTIETLEKGVKYAQS